MRRVKVHYTQFEEVCQRLASDYKVIIRVMDSQPYSELVTRICQTIPNSWGAMFVTSKNPVMFTPQEYEEDEGRARLAMRMLKINRTTAMDSLLNIIKEGSMKIAASEDIEEYAAQMTSLKRVQKFTKSGELTYLWDKTDGNDHWHFSTLYMYLATQLRGTVKAESAMGFRVPLLTVLKKPKPRGRY